MAITRLFPFPWCNKAYWVASCVIVVAIAALNTRYHSLGITSVATAVPFDGNIDLHYPREYGWPWSAICVTDVYDLQTFSPTSAPRRQIVNFMWRGVVGNLSIVAIAILIAGRTYQIAERNRAKGLWAAFPIRFSLGSLFIALTFIAIWLGVTLREAAVQKEVLDDLRARGAQVGYEYQVHGISPSSGGVLPSEAPWPFLRQVMGSEWGLRVVNVNLFKVDEDATALLRQLGRVNGVVSINCPQPIDGATPELLEALQDLPDLKECHVVNTSEATRETLRAALPECTISPHAGQLEYIAAQRRTVEKEMRRAALEHARLHETGSARVPHE